MNGFAIKIVSPDVVLVSMELGERTMMALWCARYECV
jgi:hypothetical protein